jgi:hypothetical protein
VFPVTKRHVLEERVLINACVLRQKEHVWTTNALSESPEKHVIGAY